MVNFPVTQDDELLDDDGFNIDNDEPDVEGDPDEPTCEPSDEAEEESLPEENEEGEEESPSEEEDEDGDLLEKIAAAEAECARTENDVEQCKNALKESKAIHDRAVFKLRNLARAASNDLDRPLLNQNQSDETKDDDSEQEDESWKLIGIECLELAASINDKLLEEEIDTLGALETLRAEISQGNASWPKGIGPVKITAIEDAIVDWFAANPI